MKALTPNQQTLIMKYLSPEEQKFVRRILRRRAEYWRRMKRMRAVTDSVKHTLLIGACAVGIVGGTASVQAADTPAAFASALFNEANAEQRAGDLGPAILGYERAKFLAPGDAAIAQNLRAARDKAGVTAPTVPTWQRPMHAVSFDILAALACISLALLCLLVFGTRLIPTTLRGISRGVATTLAVTALLAASALALRWPELARAVIVGARATAHIAPAAASGTAFELKPGELVTERRAHGDFVLVRTLDQRSGWVAKANVQRIIPAEANPSPM
jgi:hypothetical protein